MRNLVILYIIFSGVQFLLRWKSYNISPKEFKLIAGKSIDPNPATAVKKFSNEIRQKYDRAIVPDQPWNEIFLGGLNLQALFLHASLTEYAAVFYAPFSTSGRAGLHWSNSTCNVLSGSVKRQLGSDRLASKEAFSSGGNFRHGQFDSYIYAFSDDTTIACYGRGIMPFSGLWTATGALANGDPLSFGHLMYHYAHAMLHQVTHSVTSTINHYKKKAEL
ncbi:unnamed protein product [Auanema sp. JU1783]|nr:unnamed protein product [Auanema sp. JU1783]